MDNSDDDETYFSEPNNLQLVVKQSSSSEDEEENVYIFNIEENITYILPSPKKTRSSTRQRNVHVTVNNTTNRLTLFPATQNSVEMRINEELAVPLPVEDEELSVESTQQNECIELIWSNENNINFDISTLDCLQWPIINT